MTRDRFSDLDATAPMKPESTAPRKEAPPSIEEVRKEFREQQAARDAEIRQMIAGVANQRAQVPQESEKPVSDEEFLKQHLPEDVDPGVLEILMPVLGAQRTLMEKQIAEKYGPVADAVEREENIKVIGQRVEGFENILPEVQKLYQQLPPEEQAEYDNRVGIEALARRVIAAKRGTADMSSMSHVADPTTPPQQDSGEGPTEADVWDMSEDDFDAYLEKVRTGRRR